MFILFVFLVSMNLLMIRTDENIVMIEIKKEGQQNKCSVPPTVTLAEGNDFTLQIQSVYFVQESHWKQERGRSGIPQQPSNLLELADSKYSITYERSISTTEKLNIFRYTYSYTRKTFNNSGGTWIFTFDLLTNYDPWPSHNNQNYPPNYQHQHWSCETVVTISGPSVTMRHNFPTNGTVPAPSSNDGGDKSLKILVSVFGILLLVQSSFILYVKVRRCKANRNSEEEPRRNIANRPRLSLPPDEVVREEHKPPPMSPVPKRNHIFAPPTAPPMPVENIYDYPAAVLFEPTQSYSKKGPDRNEDGVKSPVFARRHNMDVLFEPTQSYKIKGPDRNDDGVKSPVFARRHNMDVPILRKQSNRNNALDNSNQDLTRSPGFARKQFEGPLVPKQSYTKKPFDRPEEEPRSPGFSRRQMKGPLVAKQSYRNKALDHSDEELRSPDFPRRQEGPLGRKQSYSNKGLNNSEEEIRTPSFARKQIEAKLAQLPPKGVFASKSFKLPKPLPRNSSPPSPPPEKAPAFHPAQRKDPAPPVHPKKLPVFPLPAPGRPPGPRLSDRRLSDDEWQYEQLPPASKYLDKISNTPYVGNK